MNLLLAKMGKATSVIQRNGVLKGGKIIFEYAGIFLKSFSIGTGDVLFLTGGVGDSAFYRAYNVAEELELHGFKCFTTIQDNPFLSRYVKKFKVFVFHRVIYTPTVARMIEKIKKNNGEIIFETDDLVYDPKYLQFMDYYKKMTHFEKKLYENGVGGEILRDPYVKVATTTTTYLADKLRGEGKKVIIVPNKFSKRELAIANEIVKTEKEHDDFVRVAYFSGTLSHNKDFATITDALMKVLEKYSNAKLLLAGPLDIEHKLNEFRDRIEQLPRVPRDKYYGNVYKADINLAPLELDNPFCEAKSEIKFTESGVLGIPTVAVGNQTFSGAIDDGVDGFLARTTEEWVEKIGRLIEDENLRRSMGEKAREKVLAKYTNEGSNNEEYYQYLKSKL